MAYEENGKLDCIYLMNHDVYSRVCKYTPSTGVIEEVGRDELGNDVEFWKGFYVNVKNNILGIYASSKGPILIWNHERFILEKGNFEFEIIENSPETNRFIMKYHGEEKLSIEYEKIEDYDFDNWSDEEMVDFYRWLYNNQNVEGFYHL